MPGAIRRARALAASAVAIAMLAGIGGCATRPIDPAALYKVDANWLCRPGSTTTNYCTTPDLDTTTVIAADGGRTVVTRKPLDQSKPTAKWDCFYLYPTVSLGGPGGLDPAMATNAKDEIFVTRAQFAQYSSICNTYAPLYRQATIAGFITPGALDAAYKDIVAAFDHYLTNFNQGRPFLLVGHSQGSMLLERLLKERFDANPAMRSKLISAFLIGGTVTVPAGRDTGGTFSNIKLCRAATDTGCVVTFRSSSAAERISPVSPSGVGSACVNPAALTGGEAAVKAKLPTFLDEAPPFLQTQIPDMPQDYKDITTGWIETPSALRAKCVMDGNNGRLRISANTGPGDTRNVAPLLKDGLLGLHVVETNYLLGDLLDLAAAEARHLGLG
jgi:hypothetical protein